MLSVKWRDCQLCADSFLAHHGVKSYLKTESSLILISRMLNLNQSNSTMIFQLQTRVLILTNSTVDTNQHRKNQSKSHKSHQLAVVCVYKGNAAAHFLAIWRPLVCSSYAPSPHLAWVTILIRPTRDTWPLELSLHMASTHMFIQAPSHPQAFTRHRCSWIGSSEIFIWRPPIFRLSWSLPTWVITHYAICNTHLLLNCALWHYLLHIIVFYACPCLNAQETFDLSGLAHCALHSACVLVNYVHTLCTVAGLKVRVSPSLLHVSISLRVHHHIFYFPLSHILSY